MTMDLTHASKPKEPKIDWSKRVEADNFARTVKQYRQGDVHPASFRRFRLQHGAYGTRLTDDYAMVRIKIPAGEIYPAHLEKIAQLSDAYSIGGAHITTRQSIQLHWVILEDVSEIMHGLTDVGLTSREACGNAVRNVMASPLCGVCPDEMFDSTPYALATAKFFLRNPLNQALPRKFKFTFSCCEKHGMSRIVDVGLIPQIREVNGIKQRGFKIFLGGGLGNKSFIGYQLEDFTPEEDVLYTSIAVVRLFDRLGERKNLARNRLRYLVHEMGWEKFKTLVLSERTLVRFTQSVAIKLDVDNSENNITRPISVSISEDGSTPDGFSRWYNSNTLPQKQDGYRSAFITLEAGDITSNQLHTLSKIITDFSAEGFARLGFAQDMVIRYVHEDDLANLYSELLKIGLANPGCLTMVSPVGCSGTTSCNLAITNSHRLAKEIQRKFIETKLDEDKDLADSTIKISGCPNSCGHHGIATIGFFGGGGREGKDMFPNYMMSLGGRFDGDAMLGINVLRVPAKRVIDVILKIIDTFKNDKKPDDTLKSWIHRIATGHNDTEIKSLNDIKAILEPIIIPPKKDDDPDFYSDYGSDTSYHTITGKGECAA